MRDGTGSVTWPAVVRSSVGSWLRGAGGPSSKPLIAARALAISSVALEGRSAGDFASPAITTSSSAVGMPSRRPLTRGGGSLACANRTAPAVGRGKTVEPVRHSNSIAARA